MSANHINDRPVETWLWKSKQVDSKMNRETPLVVQWLRLCTSTAGGVDLIPGQRTKILQIAWRSPLPAPCPKRHIGAQSLKRSLESNCNNNPLAKGNPVTDTWRVWRVLKCLEVYQDLGVFCALRLHVLDIKRVFGQTAVFPLRPYTP